MIEGTLNSEESAIEEYPDIEAFVDGHSLQSKFTCSVYIWDKDASVWSFCDQFPEKVPSVAEIVRAFGTGTIKWKFDRKEKDRVTGRKLAPLEYTLTVKGPKWEELHADYKREMQAERMKKLRDKFEEQRQETLYLGGVGGAGGDPEEKMMRQLTMLKTLLPAPAQQDNTFMMGFMKMMADANTTAQQNTQNFMAMMMNSMSNQTQLMMSVLSKNNSNENPFVTQMLPMFNGVTGMMQKALEMKQDMSGEPTPDMLTTLLEFGKEVLPAALKMLTPIPGPLRKPVAKAVIDEKPETKAMFKSLKDDPELLADALKTWDKTYGPAKIDELLDAAGLTRPASTFEHYDKYADQGQGQGAAPATAGADAGAESADGAGQASPEAATSP